MFSQTSSAKKEVCEYQPDIKEVKLNFDFKKTNIRDVLNYILAETGATFVVDQTILDSPTTITVKNVNWRIVLDSILRSNELGIIVESPIFRVAELKYVNRHNGCIFPVDEPDKSVLYRYYFQLKNVPKVMTKNKNVDKNFSQKNKVGFIRFITIMGKRVSNRGTVNIACNSNIVTFTDTRENLGALKKLAKQIDKPETYMLTDEEYIEEMSCK